MNYRCYWVNFVGPKGEDGFVAGKTTNSTIVLLLVILTTASMNFHPALIMCSLFLGYHEKV